MDFEGDTDVINSKVLIIDDDKVIRMMLRQVFEDNGFQNITEAVDGQEGWDKTKEIFPDIVFLDINMPRLNGFEYCKKARENINFRKMAILVQTGLTDSEEKKEIFAAGATDYVAKPVDASEIMARSIVHLKNTHYLKTLEDFSIRLKNELQSAKRLVDISLPNEALLTDIQKNNRLNIFSYFESSSEMGGDFWGVNKIDNDRVGVYIVDFSGHGVDSALNATRLDCLIKSSPEKAKDSAQLFEWLNNNLYALLPPEQYATMFYGVIDNKNNTLSYVTAACPEIFLLRSGKHPEMLSGEGYPLGIIRETKYQSRTIPFNKGDLLMVYSDALIETGDQEGNFLSNISERFLKNYKGNEFSQLRECFDKFIYEFMNEYGDNLSDDFTVVMCSRDS